MLIDTHTHLYLSQFDEDRAEVIARAKAKGVGRFYLPNIDSSSIDGMLALETAYPEACFPMMGLHPCSVKDDFEKELQLVEEWLGKRAFCAIGEIGIDLYWDKTTLEKQRIAFRRQTSWAKDLGLPIVIHSRESIDLIIEILEEEKEERLRGIFHCFTGNLEQAGKIIDLGFYLGIGGVVTFKNGGLDKTVEKLSLERLVLETDSPYLAPAPFRGKRNESYHVYTVAAKLAELKGVEIEEVAKITTANSEKIFGKNS